MRYTSFLGLFLFLGCTTHIECAPKAACNQTVACQSAEECVNGVCECQKNHYISFTTNLEILCTLAPACSPDCEKNQACVDGLCFCERGRVYVNGECRLMAGFRKRCSSYAILCDISANLSCANSTCACLETHWFDPETNSCQHKQQYLDANNVTEYKVRPGEYCRTPSDCITGLNCTDFLCKCPESCEYKQEKEVCDCGDAEVSITWPIIVGIFLGIIIVSCWAGAITAIVPD